MKELYENPEVKVICYASEQDLAVEGFDLGGLFDPTSANEGDIDIDLDL